jgi:glycosyltransferase involved in cell wall biosynthesis
MILVMGTGALGGIRNVISDHLNSEIFKSMRVEFLVTHRGRSKFEDIFLFVWSFVKLFFYLSIFKVKIVHVHMSFNGSFWRKYFFYKLSNRFSVPFVLHLHGSEFKDYVNKSSKHRLAKIKELFRRSSAVMVLSPGWKNYVDGQFGCDATVIENYVDVTSENLSRHADRKDIVFVGAFIKRKGILELIETFASSKLDCNLHLCGDGPLMATARQLVKDLNIEDQVVFHGWVGFDQKISVFKGCRLFVLPSYNEGLPLTIIEALACSCVVVSTNVGAIPEVISHGINGFIFDAGDFKQLSILLSSTYSDTAMLDQVSSSGLYEYNKRFRSEVVIPQIKAVYMRLDENFER